MLTSGASCSKLTTSLVNVSLKFKTFILQNTVIFSNKNNDVFAYDVTLDVDVKLRNRRPVVFFLLPISILIKLKSFFFTQLLTF